MAASGGASVAAIRERLAAERKRFRKDHPFGMSAKPNKKPDGSTDMFRWVCIIPGPSGTLFEDAKLRLTMHFGSDYPLKPPTVKFDPVLPHCNVFPSGRVCLSLLQEDTKLAGEGWSPTISIKDILLGVQMLLKNPNTAHMAGQRVYYDMMNKEPDEYAKYVKNWLKENGCL